MRIRKAEFLLSTTDVKDLPTARLPEYAFVGRSNVGKSSLINALLGNKDMAKTSSTPGKTQTLNSFLINEQWFLTDLPGYGFAKVSKKERAKWADMIHAYLKNREQLWCVFVLIDIRHKLQSLDADFLTLLLQNGIPFCVALTKSDKLSKRARVLQEENLKKEIGELAEPLPVFFVTSAVNQNGKEDILAFIEDLNLKF